MPGLTMVVGPNGAGKTNLLEAIHVGTQGFSPRTRRDARTVRFGAPSARVAVRGERAGGRAFATEVTIEATGGKRIVLDGASLSGPDPLRAALPVLAFTPDRLAVVKGAPVVRRTYLDRTLARLLPARARLPGEYAKALAQRNAALRLIQGGRASTEALAPWTATLAALGAELDAARAAAVELLNPRFALAAGRLGLDGARLEYEERGLTTEELDGRLALDVERGSTGVGPHLRDLGILAGDRDLRLFGSQGEQRIAVLALLLAEARALAESAGEVPLLLLDDVLSELDDDRRATLVTGVPPDAQTLVSATSLRSLPPGVEPALVVEVSPGHAEVRR